MSRFFLFFFLLVTLFFWALHSGWAEPANCVLNDDSNDLTKILTDCAWDHGVVPSDFWSGTSGFRSYVVAFAQNLLRFAALFAIGAIVFSGIRYTTAYGDDEKLKSAKTIAVYAVIGLFLSLIAFPLVKLIVDFIYTVWKSGI